LELTAVAAEDLEPADAMEYFEERIRPYNRTHVLLSFSPELLMQIEPHLKSILEIQGVEYEQGAN